MKHKGSIAFIVFVFLPALLVSVIQQCSRDIPPPDMSEFAATRPAVTTNDNAFFTFQQAAAAYEQTTNHTAFLDFMRGKSTNFTALAELVAANSNSLRLVQEGCRRKICLPPVVTSFNQPIKMYV